MGFDDPKPLGGADRSGADGRRQEIIARRFRPRSHISPRPFLATPEDTDWDDMGLTVGVVAAGVRVRGNALRGEWSLGPRSS